jgi:hypothetical protein
MADLSLPAFAAVCQHGKRASVTHDDPRRNADDNNDIMPDQDRRFPARFVPLSCARLPRLSKLTTLAQSASSHEESTARL